MSINAAELLEQVITPTLETLGVASLTPGQHLLALATRVSDLNPFHRGDGGIGIYQITPRQHRCAWDRYLAFRPDLASRIRGLASQHQFLRDPDRELKTNLAYSTAIAWVVSLQEALPVPTAGSAA